MYYYVIAYDKNGNEKFNKNYARTTYVALVDAKLLKKLHPEYTVIFKEVDGNKIVSEYTL